MSTVIISKECLRAAKLAYLTFDDVGNPALNLQDHGETIVWKVPITFGHLANIVADGASALAKLARPS